MNNLFLEKTKQLVTQIPYAGSGVQPWPKTHMRVSLQLKRQSKKGFFNEILFVRKESLTTSI